MTNNLLYSSIKNTLCSLMFLFYPSIMLSTAYSQEALRTHHSQKHYLDMYKHYQEKLKFHLSPDNLNPSYLFFNTSALTHMKYFKKKKEYTESESLLQIFAVMTYIFMKTIELKPQSKCLSGFPQSSPRKLFTLEKHNKYINKMKSTVNNMKLERLTPRDQTYLHEMITLLEIECNDIRIENHLSKKDYSLSYTLLDNSLTTYTKYYAKSATPAFLFRTQDVLLGRITYIKHIENDYHNKHKNYFQTNFSTILNQNKELVKRHGENYSLYDHYTNKY